jgi:hypothetical protein
MPGRVLNFLEFSDKYSNGSTEPASVDDIKNASANFEEGFDQETYDQPQIGPNRPVAGNYEATPATPGEEGSPAFSANNTKDMNAPQEAEESPEEEEGEADTEETKEDDEEEAEEGNPEAGANPKKKVEEGITLVKGFTQFVNEGKFNLFKRKSKDPEAAENERKRVESFWNDPDYNIPEETYEECTDCNGKGCVECNYEGHVPLKDDNTYGYAPIGDKYAKDDDSCETCGEVSISNEYGYSCGCNM